MLARLDTIQDVMDREPGRRHTVAVATFTNPAEAAAALADGRLPFAPAGYLPGPVSAVLDGRRVQWTRVDHRAYDPEKPGRRHTVGGKARRSDGPDVVVTSGTADHGDIAASDPADFYDLIPRVAPGCRRTDIVTTSIDSGIRWTVRDEPIFPIAAGPALSDPA